MKKSFKKMESIKLLIGIILNDYPFFTNQLLILSLISLSHLTLAIL